jgi:hypothetical protein
MLVLAALQLCAQMRCVGVLHAHGCRGPRCRHARLLLGIPSVLLAASYTKYGRAAATVISRRLRFPAKSLVG